MKSHIKLNERGHFHIVVALLVIALVGVAGVKVYQDSTHAASECTATVTTGSRLSCVPEAQQMVNAVLAYNYINNNSKTTINSWSVSKLKSDGTFDVVNNNFGKLNSPYNDNGVDAAWVKKIQSGVDASNGLVAKGYGGVDLKPNGAPAVSGNVDLKTWVALCLATGKINSSGDSNTVDSTDYVGGKASGSKQIMWYVRSYMRTGITAASNADCSAIEKQPVTTPPPTSGAPVISAVGNTGISTTSEKITWTTNEASTTVVEYGTTSYDKTATMAGTTESHSVTLTGLAAKTTYDYEVLSEANGKTTTSAGHVFTTEAASTGGGGGGGTGVSLASCAQGNPVLMHGGNTGPLALDGGKYNLNLNEWGSGNAYSICTNGGNNVDFRIDTSSINQTGGAPGAYSDLFYGDGSGQDTSGSGLPLQASAMTGGGVVTSDYGTNTTGTSGGNKWDDAYDIWFNPSKNSGDSVNGLGDLEMMVWLNHNGGASPAGSEVRQNVNIGGITYNVWDNTGTVSYVIANPVEQVTNLDIGLLAADAVSHHYGNDGGMTGNWYLLDVQAGFEVWNNVTGLTANNFSVSVK